MQSKKRNNILLFIELVVFGGMATFFFIIKVMDSLNSYDKIIYPLYIAASAAYLILLATILKKYDTAAHYKKKKENYIPKESHTKNKLTRRGLYRVIILYVIYISIIAVLRFSDLLDWKLFSALASIMLMINSIFCRKKCLLNLLLLEDKPHCCQYCSINGWDHFIFASALPFAPYVSTLSLLINWGIFIYALYSIIEWEYLIHKYPERFSPLTNANLGCDNCPKHCKIRVYKH